MWFPKSSWPLCWKVILPPHLGGKTVPLPSAGGGTGLGNICGFGFYSEKELQGDVLDRNSALAEGL